MLSIILALAVAQPAADRCELRDVPAVDLVALRVAILDQVKNGAARPTSAETTLDLIGAKAAGCQTGDAAAKKAASERAVARFAIDTMGDDLTANGVDVAQVDATLNAADRGILEAFVAKRFDEPGVNELGDKVIAVAGAEASPEVRKLLGAYAFNATRLRIRTAAGPAPEPGR